MYVIEFHDNNSSGLFDSIYFYYDADKQSWTGLGNDLTRYGIPFMTMAENSGFVYDFVNNECRVSTVSELTADGYSISVGDTAYMKQTTLGLFSLNYYTGRVVSIDGNNADIEWDTILVNSLWAYVECQIYVESNFLFKRYYYFDPNNGTEIWLAELGSAVPIEELYRESPHETVLN